MKFNSNHNSACSRKGGRSLLYSSFKMMMLVAALLIHAGTADAKVEKVELSTRSPLWSFNEHLYMTNMTLTCQPQIDGLPADTAYEIGAFCGNECRGNALVEWSVTKKHFVAYMVVMGNWHDSIVFRLYDHRHHAEIASAAPPQLTWEADENIGSAKNPYALNFTATSLHETDLSTPQFKRFAGKWNAQLFSGKDDSQASGIDLTAVENLPSVRPATLNPNAIVYVPSSAAQTLKDADNVAAATASADGWTARRIALIDGYPYAASRAVKADAASYQRTYSSGITTTLCLPFNFTVNGGILYRMEGVYGNALHLHKLSDGCGTANTPYLFIPSVAGAITLGANGSGITVKAEESSIGLNNDKSAPSGYSVICNYEMNHSIASDANATYYGWANDKAGTLSGTFVRCVNGAYADAFRVFLTGPAASSAKQLDISIDDDPTAIQTVTCQDADSQKMDVYSLSGTVLLHAVTRQEAAGTLPKGLYLMGGNKIILQK